MRVSGPSPTNLGTPMLPPELLARIFELACVDGGATACAIRVSSGAFKTIVDPYRFRSINIRGPRRLQLLLDQLSPWLIDEHGRRHPHREVRHLHVQDTEKCLSMDTFAAVKNMIHTFVSWASSWSQPESVAYTCMDDNASFDDLLIRITSLCAHSLVTYSAVFNNSYIDTPRSWLSPAVYPRLITLSIEYHTEHGLKQPPPESRLSLPSLQNLYIRTTHFLDAGPLAIIACTPGPIECVSFCGPADSFILEYTLDRFKAGAREGPCKGGNPGCRNLQLELTRAPADPISSYRSEAAEQLLKQLAVASPDGAGLVLMS